MWLSNYVTDFKQNKPGDSFLTLITPTLHLSYFTSLPLEKWSYWPANSSKGLLKAIRNLNFGELLVNFLTILISWLRWNNELMFPQKLHHVEFHNIFKCVKYSILVNATNIISKSECDTSFSGFWALIYLFYQILW